jgi:hypothetical protein
MTTVCEEKDTSASEGLLQPVRQRKRCGGVEIFYVILDPLFYLPHPTAHFTLFFKYMPGFVLWGPLPFFHSEENEDEKKYLS